MGTPPVLSAPTETNQRSLLINRNFARLWSGQVVTDLGTVIFNTALIVWVAAVLAHGQSEAPLVVSGLLLAQSLPMVVVRPFAGVFVDRWDARRMMLWMDTGRAVLIALLLILVAMSLTPFWLLAALYAIVLLVSVCTQFFNTALLALINDLVPEQDLPRAIGLSEVTWSIASVLGPPLAAPIVLGLGIEWVLVLNAISFVVSYFTLRAIRPPLLRIRGQRVTTGTSRGAWAGMQVLRELYAAFRFLMGQHVVRTVTLAMTIALLGAGMLHALDYFFVTQSLHAPPALYGLVGLAFGGGSIVGALLAGRIATRLGIARTFMYSLLGVGLVIVLLSRQTSLIPALAIWVLLGIVNSATNVALMPLLLNVTPREFVGRMNALFFTIISAASLFSAVLAGWMASDMLRGFFATLLGLRFGPADTLLTLTGVLICASGVYAAVNLRREDSP